MHGSTAEVIEAARDWLAAEEEPEPLVVETSGSTGRPKQVVLSRQALVASARATHERLDGPGRWLLTLPASYVAGLQVVVRSLVGGADPVVVDEHDSFGAAAAHALADGPAYVSLVPTQLHRMLGNDAEAQALSSLSAVLVGGGPMDPALRVEAEGRGIRVVATYGSSETSGGCVYDGVPLAGVQLDVRDGEPLRISGPTLFDGYQDDPELTAAALVDGWFVTSDLARIVDGRLQVIGRVDDMVISGGVKVPTPAVRRRLLDHPRVKEVEVLGVPDQEWGQRLVAFVVGDLDLETAREWVAAEHPRTWAPREVVGLETLPFLPTGKVDRVALRGMVVQR